MSVSLFLLSRIIIVFAILFVISLIISFSLIHSEPNLFPSNVMVKRKQHTAVKKIWPKDGHIAYKSTEKHGITYSKKIERRRNIISNQRYQRGEVYEESVADKSADRLGATVITYSVNDRRRNNEKEDSHFQRTPIWPEKRKDVQRRVTNLAQMQKMFSKKREKVDLKIEKTDVSDRKRLDAQTKQTSSSSENRTSFSLGVFSSRNSTSWNKVSCDLNISYRLAKLSSKLGPLNMYIYNSSRDDLSITDWALKGKILEGEEIEHFLQLTNKLPLIDVGANLGTVALQAAAQKRPVVALEPVYSNAARLCRSAVDFDLKLLVVLNAASSGDGEVILAMDTFQERARYSVQTEQKSFMQIAYDPIKAYAIRLDTLLEVLPFQRAALKIDVEGHEGHVLAGSERLFQQVYIPYVWLEWEHVKNARTEYGKDFILDFMRIHSMEPCDIISGERLPDDSSDWPDTVLWKLLSEKIVSTQ